MAVTAYSRIGKAEEVTDGNHDSESSDSLLREGEDHHSNPGKQSLRTYLPWLLHGILLLFSAMMLLLAMKHERVAQSKHSAFSPALSTLGAYHTTRFNGTFDAPSPYRGPPSADLDAAWSRITDIGVFALSDAELKSVNPTYGDSAVELPDVRGGQTAGSLEVFHQLHCLNFLRQSTYMEFYKTRVISFQDEPEVVRTHIDHCIEMLRQTIMCQSDLGVLSYNWVEVQENPWPNFNTQHRCRDFEKVLEWGKEKQVMEFGEKMTKTRGATVLPTPPELDIEHHVACLDRGSSYTDLGGLPGMENEEMNQLRRYIDSFRDESSRAVMRADTAPLGTRANDIEGLQEDMLPAPPSEYRVSTGTKCLYLGLYFALNLALTIYNKAILGKFAFPWLLTSIHTGTASIGCYLLLLRGHFKLTRLEQRENVALLAFSLLYTVNIAISNVSLAMVSMPFHQVLRSTCPVVAVLIYRFYYSRSYSTATYLSLIPIMFGVGLATYGDYYFTRAGFFLTFLGVILAALKTIASNRLMTGSLALPALEILLRMSPLAAAQSLLYSISTGEAQRFLDYADAGNLTNAQILALAGNGVLAFLLSVASLHTNRLAGALTMTVCANLKQCLTVMLGVVLFDVKVGILNGYGMGVTLIGAAIYSKVELDSKGRATSDTTEEAEASAVRFEEK